MAKYPLHDLRKRWVPLIKTAVASGADIGGDYIFYSQIKSLNNDNLKVYELPLFIFFIVACIFGGLTIITLLCKGCCPQNKNVKKMRGRNSEEVVPNQGRLSLSCCVNRINHFLYLEILLEDVPQFILTTLIMKERGLLTPAAAINIATSAYNFIFNIFDMITPDPIDDDDSDGKKNDGDVEVSAEA
jgi:hypothetical protein